MEMPPDASHSLQAALRRSLFASVSSASKAKGNAIAASSAVQSPVPLHKNLCLSPKLIILNLVLERSLTFVLLSLCFQFG